MKKFPEMSCVLTNPDIFFCLQRKMIFWESWTKSVNERSSNSRDLVIGIYFKSERYDPFYFKKNNDNIPVYCQITKPLVYHRWIWC